MTRPLAVVSPSHLGPDTQASQLCSLLSLLELLDVRAVVGALTHLGAPTIHNSGVTNMCESRCATARHLKCTGSGTREGI